MEKKLVITGILAAVLAFSIVFTGCKKKEEAKKEEDKQNTIIITGLPGEFSVHSNNIVIMVTLSFDDFSGEVLDAIGYVGRDDITGDTVTIPLLDMDKNPWTKSGSYLVMLYSELYYGDGVSQNIAYIYTGGKTFRELGIRSKTEKADYYNSKLPKINFKAKKITLSFDDFADMNEI